MSKSFRYVHLFQQCDALLLMGGIGVEHCARPAYREPGSHVWRGKRPLPSSFLHGTELNVACWQERYQSFRAGYRHATETLHCVNGDWYNSLQLPELTAFSCEPCVLVAGKGLLAISCKFSGSSWSRNLCRIRLKLEHGERKDSTEVTPTTRRGISKNSITSAGWHCACTLSWVLWLPRMVPRRRTAS